jgi:nickel-dependent lactate racemase
MNQEPIAEIAYGNGHLPLRMDPELADWHVFRPQSARALPDPRAAFLNACRNPTASDPLDACVSPGDRVVIVTSDGTRPVPNRLLISWLLESLPVPAENVTVLLGTGTHRPNTPEEIRELFGALADVVAIVNHDAYDPGANARIGTTPSGIPVTVDKRYLEADRRIVIGFIEPHFFAGFSGGAKGVFPGVAGIETIPQLHAYRLIADPMSTWGELDRNPIQREIAEMIALCPPDFLVNVTLNEAKQISGVFAGHYREAHRAGCARAKAASMVPVPERFPIVVTSNSGFPLDQNLYQTVKGMSAAARIVAAGGHIVTVSECRDGIPEHGNFGDMLRRGDSPAAIIEWIRDLESPRLDQWQVQILAEIQLRAAVALHSRLAPALVESLSLRPITRLQEELDDLLRQMGGRPAVAVLPDGPLTIPYLT